MGEDVRAGFERRLNALGIEWEYWIIVRDEHGWDDAMLPRVLSVWERPGWTEVEEALKHETLAGAVHAVAEWLGVPEQGIWHDCPKLLEELRRWTSGGGQPREDAC